MTNNPKSQDTPKPSDAPETRASNPSFSDQASQTASEIASTAQQTASNIAGIARQGASSQFARQKRQTAAQLGNLAKALRQAGGELRKEEQHTIPAYFDLAADRVEDLSGYVKATDAGQAIDAVENLGRRQPLLYVGGAFALGLLAVRFLNSSGSARSIARGETPKPRAEATPRQQAASTTGATAPKPVAWRAPRQAAQATRSLQSAISGNPLVAGAVAIAAGAVVAALIPHTEAEDRLMGEARDSFVESAQSAAQEALEQVREKTERIAADAERAMNEHMQKKLDEAH